MLTIFGLQNDGVDVISTLVIVENDVKKLVPSHFMNKKSGQIVIDDLIKNIIESGTYDDDFVRKAVLVLIGTVIAPYSTKFVPLRYYKLMEDVEVIKSYNWNNFTLRVCMDGIKATNKNVQRFEWPKGNLALIQVNLNI